MQDISDNLPDLSAHHLAGSMVLVGYHKFAPTATTITAPGIGDILRQSAHGVGAQATYGEQFRN